MALLFAPGTAESPQTVKYTTCGLSLCSGASWARLAGLYSLSTTTSTPTDN